MSWFPGITSRGRSSPRRNAAARSCSRLRPRCARSPVTAISSGPTRSIRPARLPSRAVSSALPACKSEMWRSRVVNAEAGYTLRYMAEESTEIFDDLYLGLRAGGALARRRRGGGRTAKAAARRAADDRGAGGARTLAASFDRPQVTRDRRLRARHVRPRFHARRPHLRPLAQSLTGA